MMLQTVTISAVLGAGLFLAWYFWFQRVNRRRAIVIVRKLEMTLRSYGHVTGIRWITPSSFYIPIRLSTNVFQHASVLIEMMPREVPLLWLWRRIRDRQETATFEADLDNAPSFNLQLGNHRWCGRTRKRISTNPDDWNIERTGIFVISSRHDWEREVIALMDALLACRDRDLVSVRFRRSSPHFTATMPLSSLSSTPDSGEPGLGLFDVLRELAEGASASKL
jgi:hypothetical protein